MTRLQWLVVGVAGLAYLAWCGHYVARTSFVVDGQRVFCLWDDGMISMQYARNLARGHGLVWNAGEAPVQGFTNLGVTLVMALAHLLPLPPARMALAVQALNLGALAAIAALTFALARTLCPASPRVAVAATLGTLVCAPLGIWSLQGSDAGFVCLWLLATMLVAARRDAAGRAWPPGLFALLGLGLVLRTDAVVLVVVLCAGGLRTTRTRARRFSTCAAVVTLVTAALVVHSQLVYGDPLPNTYYLKATGSPRGLVLRSGLAQLLQWLPGLVPALVLAGLATHRHRGRPWVVTAAGLVIVLLGYCVWVGGDWAPEYGNRMFVPCLPLVAILAAMGLEPLVDRALVDWTARARGWGLSAAAVVVGMLANPWTASGEWWSVDTPTMFHEYNARNYTRAAYVADVTDRDTVLGVYWAGTVVYFAERPAVDLLGKSDRHIAKLEVPRFSPGHSKWDWDYVLHTRRPDVLFMTRRGLAQHPDFARLYVEIWRGEARVLFLRRAARSKLHDEAARARDFVPER